MDTFGCGADYIVRNPVLLTLTSASASGWSRGCRAIEALKARGVDVGEERLTTILRKTEARFMERYMLRYSHQAPELLELYPPDHHNGSLSGDSSTIGSSSQSEGDWFTFLFRHLCNVCCFIRSRD
jgi:mTERF domain-containing protein